MDVNRNEICFALLPVDTTQAIRENNSFLQTDEVIAMIGSFLKSLHESCTEVFNTTGKKCDRIV
jgi:hypothetical protein